jgi:hypothetical protein
MCVKPSCHQPAEAYTMDSIVNHMADLRRSSMFLYQSGLFTQGDHARMMRKIFTYEARLMRKSTLDAGREHSNKVR